jgi:hypothetical protein
MGAYYYDQSPPVQVLVRPREIPYLIPAEGGTLEFTIRGKNRELVALTITFWCDVTLPDCTIYGPVLGPLDLTIPPGETLVRDRRQNVPAVAPMGVYYFNAYAILGADTSKDSFMWGKLGVGVWRLGNGKWANTGEAFKTVLTEEQRIPNNIPNDFNVSLYPNPFNAGAKISYTLPETEHIRIAIYDLSGREVSILVEGIINAGMNEAVFDGSELPCGIYFVKLQTAEFQKTQKIVLLK